ncbi:adenylate kinase [Arthrobacter sp. JSM 101049]|uniref:adenylate kinase n=1 Tax=Arthrobacter sp. JSM 101049 TaxID=929097 RepID=UPI0035689012
MTGDGAAPPSLPSPLAAARRRILIVGVTGSGKSTLAGQLGRHAGLRVHLADEEIGWLPGWVQRDPAEQRRMALERAAAPEWVFDSAYGHYHQELAARAELIVCLDYPRLVSLGRLVLRSLRRVTQAEPVCNGNVETWAQLFSRDSILLWHARSFGGKRQRMRSLLETYGPHKVLVFRCPRQTARWLRGVKATGRVPG